MFELPCDACRTLCLADFLVRTSAPMCRRVCEECAEDLEREPSCDCGGTGCRECLGAV